MYSRVAPWQQNALFCTIILADVLLIFIFASLKHANGRGMKPAQLRSYRGRRNSTAHPSTAAKGKQGGLEMEKMTRMYLKASELGKRLSKGQTMTEYALILAAVAIVVFITYEVMGQDISTLVGRIDTALTTS
jgi:Flp pilus assembly pilin Flp